MFWIKHKFLLAKAYALAISLITKLIWRNEHDVLSFEALLNKGKIVPTMLCLDIEEGENNTEI